MARGRSPGTSSRSRSSRLPARSVDRTDNPVTLLSGRARLATSPLPTGSPATENTIGIVAVACVAATISGVPEVRVLRLQPHPKLSCRPGIVGRGWRCLRRGWGCPSGSIAAGGLGGLLFLQTLLLRRGHRRQVHVNRVGREPWHGNCAISLPTHRYCLRLIAAQRKRDGELAAGLDPELAGRTTVLA